MRYDLVCLGEPLLRLSPPGHGQLRRATSLNVVLAGSQFNVAANLAMLGKSTTLLTKLPVNPLGDLALDTIRGLGVDVSNIKQITGSKMGVTYVEFSAAPRDPYPHQDRAGSAASTISPGDFDWDAILKDTRFVYTDGIFPCLSPSCRESAHVFFDVAKRNGCTTCFDVNPRDYLRTPEEAKTAWAELLPKVDIVDTNRGVSEYVFGWSGSDEEVMRHYADEFGCKVVCLTTREEIGMQQGAWQSMALVDNKIVQGQRFTFEIVDKGGTGDAWFAGFLYGYMEKDVEYALNYGNAICALAHTIEGDVAYVRNPEVDEVMQGRGDDVRVRRYVIVT